MDELLTWAPRGALGDLRKIDASIKSMTTRLEIIEDWNENGGVLVLGYEMFRTLIANNSTAKRIPPLDPQEHKNAKLWLLDGPNIVVADEAHKMKNATAGLTVAASQFRTRTRLAMTGSPLANNVEEYHTMIEWIAPNYLGPIVEFRAKYVEPIQRGMFSDSTSSERRKSLKMLNVLNRDLTPKVHRADISVLRGHLKPKTEFVIQVPLTPVQEQAYRIYVRSMLNSSYVRNAAGELAQSTLWHWLAVLALLCNHPECFKNKLQERKDEADGNGRTKKPSTGDRLASATQNMMASDDDAEDISPMWKVGVTEELMTKEMALFAKVADITDVALSHKVSILIQILDASKAAGDKVLVFSQSLPTLNYLEALCKRTGRIYTRLDGKTDMAKRQAATKNFNAGNTELYLISTTAGGLGLNLPGANRVIIFDFKFNPINEEQAIGRAFRIGQQKPVFVYRFVVGGTFEDRIHNKAVFKMQLASKVVDKKNPIAWAKKKRAGDFLFEPKEVNQDDLSSAKGKDPQVLDKILEQCAGNIRSIVMTDIFERHDDDILTAEEQKEVDQLFGEEQLKRTNPTGYEKLMKKRLVDQATREASFRAQHHARLQHSPLQASAVNADRTSSNLLLGSTNTPPQNCVIPTLPVTHTSSNRPPPYAPARPGNAPIAGAGTKTYIPPPRKRPEISSASEGSRPILDIRIKDPSINAEGHEQASNRLLIPKVDTQANLPQTELLRPDVGDSDPV